MFKKTEQIDGTWTIDPTDTFKEEEIGNKW